MNPSYTTLVLVTDQFSCERIIKAASIIAELSGTRLEVLSVMKSNAQVNPDAIEHLFSVAKEYNANMIVKFADDPQSTIVHSIKENKAVNVVTGIPQDETSILVSLWKMLSNVKFYTVSKDGELHEAATHEFARAMLAAGAALAGLENAGRDADISAPV